MGPKTEPCGTPIFTFLVRELLPFKQTICLRSDRYDLNHFNSVPDTPYLCNFLSKMA